MFNPDLNAGSAARANPAVTDPRHFERPHYEQHHPPKDSPN